MIENIKNEIARELNDPRSPWTHTELFARLKMVEEAEDFLRFSGYFSPVFLEFPDNVS